MGAIKSQITSLTIVYSTVYSGADQRKHQSSVSLAFLRGIHRGPVDSPHKWSITRKMFPFDDVIMVIYNWTMSIHCWGYGYPSTRLAVTMQTTKQHEFPWNFNDLFQIGEQDNVIQNGRRDLAKYRSTRGLKKRNLCDKHGYCNAPNWIILYNNLVQLFIKINRLFVL